MTIEAQLADGRVLEFPDGTDPSVIAGKLSSNGRVVLTNAQGILFAPGSEVNVGSLVASALQNASGDFSTGTATFTGRGGNVVNQ